MEYQKIINLLDNTTNQPTKFGSKNWVEINDELRGAYNKDNHIRFKTSMLRLSLCDYSDAYILVKGTITVVNTAANAAGANNFNKKVIFKKYELFTTCISRINNALVDNAQYIDVVMPIYDLIEYNDNYSKTSAVLWQYCRNEPVVDDNGAIIDFNEDNADTNLFRKKEKIASQTRNNGTKNTEIMVPLKYLSNLWRTLEMPLINYEINLDLNWSEKCVIVATNIAAQAAIFSITDTKLYAPVVTLSTQDHAKLLE